MLCAFTTGSGRRCFRGYRIHELVVGPTDGGGFGQIIQGRYFRPVFGWRLNQTDIGPYVDGVSIGNDRQYKCHDGSGAIDAVD